MGINEVSALLCNLKNPSYRAGTTTNEARLNMQPFLCDIPCVLLRSDYIQDIGNISSDIKWGFHTAARNLLSRS